MTIQNEINSDSMSEMGKAVYYRTYSRPKGETKENFYDTVDRIIEHQRWLWERQLGVSLNNEQIAELDELREINLNMKALPRRQNTLVRWY